MTWKIQQFFTASAIKQAEDAWWDIDNHFVVTKADNDLDQIMDQDQDLFFLNRAVEVNMGNTDTNNKTKIQADLMSTRSISMFMIDSHGNDTKDTKMQPMPNGKTKTKPDIGPSIHDDWNHAFRKNIDTLLKCLLLTMQAKNLINPQEMATGSQKASKNK